LPNTLNIGYSKISFRVNRQYFFFVSFATHWDTAYYKTVKGKAVALQAWSGPEGSKKLSFSDFMKTAQDGGKVVGLTHGPPLPP